MADKPSRALILHGDGLMRLVEPSHAHLHSLASRGFCGFLSLPHSPPSETEETRILREFSELLDASDYYSSSVKEVQTIPARFMGMKVGLVTDDAGLQNLGGKLGLSVIPSEAWSDNKQTRTGSIADTVSLDLLTLLGFKQGETMEKSQFDLLFVHIGAGEKNAANDVDFLNDLVGKIMETARPGSEIGSRLHLSVVISYGLVTENDLSATSILPDRYNASGLSAIIPRQSYRIKGGHRRENVRNYAPMLVAQSQDAVTRKDKATIFSFENFKEHGGNLTIPADRLLHEVAFKLWKAPKYGA